MFAEVSCVAALVRAVRVGAIRAAADPAQVLDLRLGQKIDRADGGEAFAQVDVFAAELETFVPAADLLELGPADEKGGAVELPDGAGRVGSMSLCGIACTRG